MQPIDLVSQYMGQYKDLGDELNVKICPFCGGGSTKRDNKYKFYVNKEDGAFKCYRENSCGRTGSFYDLAKHFNVEDKIEKSKNYKSPKKKYKKPDINTQKIKDKTIVKYLKARGFHKEMINQLPLEQYNHPAYGKVIAFMYYRNTEDKAPTFIKYRNFKRKDNGRIYRREKGTKPILWNMENIKVSEPVLITEGEFDTMAAIQCGFKNTVSIPSGTSDFSWVDNCWDFLQEIDEFIIWGDNDKAGAKFQEECASKLGESKCKIVKNELYNDANEVMYEEGDEAVLNLILNAEYMPLENITSLADVPYYNENDGVSITSGFKKLDKYTNGFGLGEISVWTGQNGAGKSTLIDQVLIESINAGFNVCAFSGETPKEKYRKNIDLQLASHRFNETFTTELGAKKYITPRHIRDYIGQWYRDKFYLFDADRTRVDANKVLEQFEQTAKRYNCRVFLIDNLIKMNLDKNNFYGAQSEFIDKCSVFAHRFNAHVHIVAHPRKTDSGVSKMDIAGSADITNLADNVYLIVNTSKNENKNHDGELGVLKHRDSGNSGIKVELMFDYPSLRFYEVKNPVQAGRKYGWEKEYKEEVDD